MRTISTAQGFALANPDRSHHIKVQVYDGSSWINLNSHHGRDWVQEVSYGESQDGRAMDASVVLTLADHSLNLSPLMTGSLINESNTLLATGNPIRIDAAVMPMDSTPASGDWMEVFRGEIDAYEMALEKITLRCRDLSGPPSDAFIEKEKDYADDALELEEVIQDILDEWPMPDGATYLTLYSVQGTAIAPWNGADSPGWVVAKGQPQRIEPVYDAIRTLAASIGYELRYTWHENTSQFQLVMWEPDRAAAGGVDRSFGADEYYAIKSVSFNRRNVRNVCQVLYTDSDGNRQVEEDTDAASVAAHGRRWCRLAEEASSQINSSSEAGTLAEACVDDLKDPVVTITVDLPFFPWAQLQDYYTIEANGAHFDANQSLALIDVRHRISATEAITSMTLEGKPAKSKRAWLGIQQRNVKRTLDSKVVNTKTSSSNLCPNGDLTQWDGG